MSYKLNKTDGSLLVELVDGRLDTTSADINLIGKNYQGFGESINENFIRLLENFSNTSAPSKPIKGQLWYDTATGRLKVYDGITFRSTDSTIYASAQPSELIEGDIWIDGSKDQMYFWNGIELKLVGPAFTKNQLTTGDVVETVFDTTGLNKVITKRYLNGSLVAIESKIAFTPFPAISGFTDLKAGWNISSSFPDYEFHGKADSAGYIEDQFGNVFDQNSFLSSQFDDTTFGKINISNDEGVIIGSDSDLQIRVSGNNSIIKTIRTDNDFQIKLKDSVGEYTAMNFDTSEKRVAFFTESAPQYTVDIAGDLRVTGNILVEGDTTSLDVATLRVEDKQIELAITDDSTLISDIDADDAGVVVRVQGDDKRWTWRQASDSWTSSHGINLEKNVDSYFIGTANVLSLTTLGTSVLNSSLTSVGQLNSLAVGANGQPHRITISEDTIYCSTALNITSTGDITFNNQVIKGVDTPVDNTDVANKKYVDDQAASVSIITGVDVTGLGSSYATGTYGGGGDQTLLVNVATLLTEISPPNPGGSGSRNGTVATIHAVYYEASTDPIDINANINKTLQAVDSAGVQNVNVIGDFTITNPTATVTLTVTRLIITLEIASGLWDATTGSITASAL